MKYDKELKIGIFVVSILVASFFLINYLRGEDLFNKEVEVSSRYDDVEGLVASAPVYIKGYKAGKVSEVAYDREKGDFVVTCAVSRDFPLPLDSKMIIYSVDIMGGKGIRIDLGTSEDHVKDGDLLASSFEAGLMDGLADSVGPLLAKVSSTIDSLSVTVSSVNEILNESNRRSIASTLRHLENTIADVNDISSAVEGKSDEILGFIDSLNELSSGLSALVAKADTTVLSINDKLSAIDASQLNEVMLSFKQILSKINDPDGTLGRILVDDSIYSSLDSLLSDVDELVRKIQDNPKKYIRISVF